MSNNKFEQFAERLFFRGGHIPSLMNEVGIEFKEGKTSADVITAFRAGMEKGRGKIEREMYECGVAIGKVCKETAPHNQQQGE